MSAGGHTSDVRVSVRTRRTMKIAHNFSYSITMGPCQPSGNIFPDSIGRRRGSIGSSSDAKSKIEVCTTTDFGVFVLSPPLKKNTLRYSFLVFAQKGQRFKNCSNSHVYFQKHVGSESSRVIVSKSVLVRLFGVLCLLLRNHQTPFEAH